MTNPHIQSIYIHFHPWDFQVLLLMTDIFDSFGYTIFWRNKMVIIVFVQFFHYCTLFGVLQAQNKNALPMKSFWKMNSASMIFFSFKSDVNFVNSLNSLRVKRTLDLTKMEVSRLFTVNILMYILGFLSKVQSVHKVECSNSGWKLFIYIQKYSFCYS